MTDGKALMGLLRQYERARQDLVEAVLKSNGVGTKTYANTLLRRIDRILQRLKEETRDYANTEIRKEYEKALEDVRSYYERNNLLMNPANTAFSQIHEDAIDSLVREMQYEVEQGIAQVGRRIARHIEAAVDNILRSAALEQTSRKIATGATLRKLQKNLVSQLQNEGIFSVQYGSGLNAYRVSLNAYASMVARSTTREAGNVARINSATEHGYDLVLCTSHYPTCEMCAPIQGRVYSISGKDKRFPALSTLPGFKDGYYTIHPNCRHVFVPTVENLWTDEERERYLAAAKKPTEGDTRSKKEIDLYARQQSRNRNERQTRYQYERYKSVLGKDAPKTYAAFKRIKNADGDLWRFMQLDYRRKNALLVNTSLSLPNAESARIDVEKFTGYLFNINSVSGWAKGAAFKSRLGYNENNWTKLRDEIQNRAPLYPVTYKSTDVYGDKYEQRIIVYGLKGKPANVVIGWKVKDQKTWLTSLYIKEVD